MNFKKFLGILILLFSIFIIFIISVYLYVRVNGRTIILTELEKNLGVKAEISGFHVGFPLSIVIEDFVVKDSIHVDKIIIVPSLFGFLKGDVVLNSCVLDKPYFKIIRETDETFDFGVISYKPAETAEKPALAREAVLQENIAVVSRVPEKPKRARNFYLKRLKIKNAVIDFIDKTIGSGEDFRLRLDEFNVNICQVSFLSLSKMRLSAQGQLKPQQGVAIGSVELSGWFDYPARAMDMKVRLKDARLAYLGPYYMKFFKKELESGNMLLSADLKSEHNALKADCHVELDHIAFKNNEDSAGKNNLSAGDFAALAFDSILLTRGKMIFDFSIQTKMDRPRFENVRFKGTFLENGMKAIFSKGSQVAASVATGDTKETVKDFKEISKKFKDFGKKFKGMFKKD